MGTCVRALLGASLLLLVPGQGPAEKPKERSNLKGNKYTAVCLAFSPTGAQLATGGGPRGGEPGKAGELKLWDVGTGKERATLKGHTELVTAVAFASDGKTLAS